MNADEAITILHRLAPNTLLNSRCPWKGKRDVTRMWCPLPVHGRSWVRLLVISASEGHAVLECAAGCEQEDLELFVFNAGVCRREWRHWPPETPEYSM